MLAHYTRECTPTLITVRRYRSRHLRHGTAKRFQGPKWPLHARKVTDTNGVVKSINRRRGRARPPLQGNPAIKAGHLESLTATVAIGSRAFLAGSRGNRALNVTAEFSLPASDYDFWRYEVDATWRQPTIGRRRLLPAILDLRFKAGYGSSALPLQRAFMVDSSVGSYAGPGMLRSVGGRPFEGDDMIAFFWAHNFRTMPFEMLKLRSLVKGGYSIILFGGHATTWLPDVDFPDADADAIRRLGTRGIYHELGFSLAGIMGWLRLDVAAGLGRSSVRMGLGAYSPF